MVNWLDCGTGLLVGVALVVVMGFIYHKFNLPVKMLLAGFVPLLLGLLIGIFIRVIRDGDASGSSFATGMSGGLIAAYILVAYFSYKWERSAPSNQSDPAKPS